jgi:hypothetical protein
MKVITVKGCRDCPYLNESLIMPESQCYFSNINFYNEETCGNDIPETPHPDCKLPDLPTSADIEKYAENQNYILGRTESIELGANYILNAIKK